jgi:hypothetical protein
MAGENNMGSSFWEVANGAARHGQGPLSALLAELHARQAHHDERVASFRYAFGLSAPAQPDATVVSPGFRRLSDLDRREFLRLLSAAGTFLAVPPGSIGFDLERLGHHANRTHGLDDEVLAQYTALNDQLWRSFSSSMSKGAVFAMVRRQLDALTGLLERAHPTTVHRRLCSLAADLFQLSGEVLFDASHHTEAAHCYTFAANAAKEAGAFDLWACAITRHAFIAVYERRHRAAIPMLGLAARVAVKGDPSLSTRYWVDAVLAQAHAGAGDLDRCERSLESAERVDGLAGPVHNGGWLRFDRSRLAEERGACFVELCRPGLAEPILGDAVGQPLSVRRRGIVLADLAAVGAQRREVEQIVRYGQAAADVAALTNSGVIIQRLRGLQSRLGPCASSPDVKELSTRIDDLAACR